MSIRKWLALICLPIAVISSGCSHDAANSDRQRELSFRSYESTQIDGQPLSLFLRCRTAIIIRGIDLVAACPGGETLTLYLPPKSGNLSYGLATAIEHDGYLLTASHCVGSGVNYLVYFDGQSARIAIVRLVANAPDLSLPIDVAVIHVDAALPEIFTWSSDDQATEQMPVVAVGAAGSGMVRDAGSLHMSLQETCFAGTVTSLERGTGTTLTIRNDLPIRSGDSGGPLATTTGNLLGVETFVVTSEHDNAIQSQSAGAIRPDPSWLRRAIQEDRNRQVPSAPISIPTTRPATPNVSIIVSY